MSESHIWIDITELMGWRGAYTGIQRVLHNLALHFSHENAAQFYLFRRLDRRLIALSPAQLKRPLRSDDQNEPDHASALRRWARASLPEWQHQAPAPLQPLAFGLTQAAYELDAAQQIVRGRSAPLELTVRDTVLVLGAPWSYPGMLDVLNRQKAQLGFRLCYLIFDATPTLFPHLFPRNHVDRFNAYLRKVSDGADLLLTISQSTKRDLLRLHATGLIRFPDIAVIRLGDDVAATTPMPNRDLPEPFLLSVGTIEVRKNHLLLYQTYKLAAAEGIDLPRLVIAGRRGWLTHDLLHAFRHDPQVRTKISLLHEVSDAQLAWLYGNCLFTLYPSIYEGWGLPIAESLNHGRVCLCSSTSSMPEIAGDLLEYFSPFDPRSCLNLIRKYLAPEVRAAKETEIELRYSRVPWERTYRDVRAALRAIES